MPKGQGDSKSLFAKIYFRFSDTYWPPFNVLSYDMQHGKPVFLSCYKPKKNGFIVFPEKLFRRFRHTIRPFSAFLHQEQI